MISESQIETRLRNKIKRLGGMCLKMIMSHFTGFPDRLCLLPEGRLFFIELKAPGESPRKRQLYVHRQLERLGFKVLVLDSYESVDKFIEDVR